MFFEQEIDGIAKQDLLGKPCALSQFVQELRLVVVEVN
jgi:hypothetical protein